MAFGWWLKTFCFSTIPLMMGPIKVTPQKDIQDHTRLEFATILLVKALFVMIITL